MSLLACAILGSAALLPSLATAQQAAPAPTQSTESPRQTPTSKQRRQAEKLYLQGAKALDADNPRTAFEDFSAALDLDPANAQYLAAREVARQHLVTQLVQQASKARLLQKPADSQSDLTEAFKLDPKNPLVAQHIDELAEDQLLTFGQEDEHGAEIAGPIEITPSAERKSFHLKGSEQDLLRQVLSAYQITPVMDASVDQKQIRIDVDDLDYAQASNVIKLLSNTFFVPLDPKRVLVAKDTKENRKNFERLSVESVYLPGLSTTEMTDVANVAKNVFETPVATVQQQRGVLTVRAPEPRIKALNATLQELLDGRSQLQLELRLYEVNQTRTRHVGIVLPQQTSIFNVQSELNSLLQNNQSAIQQIISSGLAQPGDYAAILAILIASGQISSSVLTNGFLTFGGGLTQFGYNLGSATGNLALNSSDARSIDEVKLRVQDQETATFRAGTRYPIVTSTYTTGGATSGLTGINSAGLSSSLNNLGVNLSSSANTQVTIPQIQYEDLGLTLKAIPHIQHNQEVALKLDFKIVALGGSSINGNPILNNRSYTADITLREGDSALVVSSLSKQESNAVSGVPGLSELPGLQSTTDDSKEYDFSNLVLLVTPHIVRKSHTQVAGREIVLPKHD